MAESSLSGPENRHTLVSALWYSRFRGNPFKNIFDFTTAGDRDFVRR